MKTLTAVLFVGGESRRMGADKATLLLAGEPLWARQLRVLRELSPENILISARSKPAWGPPEIEVVLDAPPGCGPLGGLAAALGKMETTHLLALAVDLPGMEAEFLRRLWAGAAPGQGVAPVSAGYFEPLGAIYPAAARTPAAEFCRRGNGSLQNFLRELSRDGQMKALQILPADQGFFFNANTPAEFARR